MVDFRKFWLKEDLIQQINGQKHTQIANAVSGTDAGYIDISQYTQPNTVNTCSIRYGEMELVVEIGLTQETIQL